MSTGQSPNACGGSTNSRVRALSFLDLPAELRNQIYSYMESLHADLCKDPPTTYRRRRIADGGNTTCSDGAWWAHYAPTSLSGGIAFPTQPPITRVCRQIRNETLPIFYGANDFVFLDSYCGDYTRALARENKVQVETPFPAVLMRGLGRIRGHLHLVRKLKIKSTREYCAQTAHESVAMLMDLGLPFEERALVAEDIDGRS